MLATHALVAAAAVGLCDTPAWQHCAPAAGDHFLAYPRGTFPVKLELLDYRISLSPASIRPA